MIKMSMTIFCQLMKPGKIILSTVFSTLSFYADALISGFYFFAFKELCCIVA